MVIMAVVTTAAAGPLLRIIYPQRAREQDRLATEPVFAGPVRRRGSG